MDSWHWSVQSEGPGRIALTLRYRGGQELTTRKGLAKVFLKLTRQLAVSFLPRGKALPRERDLTEDFLLRRLLDRARGANTWQRT